MSKPVCIVVGVGEGMGMALARRFGREGYQLGLVARGAEALARYCTELAQLGIASKGYACDLAGTAAVTTTLKQIQNDLGSCAVLIYNASVYREAGPSTLRTTDLVADLSVNVVAALAAAQAVLPAMQQNKQGSILLTGGGTALEPVAALASLSIGKAAMRSLALCLHAELGPQGIHAGTVTIGGAIKPGTKFDPDQIAEAFWQLHSQPAGQWQAEVQFK